MKISKRKPRTQRSYPTAPTPAAAAPPPTKPAPVPPGAVTETQAREHWCPFVRVPYYAGGGAMAINRAGDLLADPSQQYRCIASQCMAWRWDTSDQGHCGLAGGLS